MKRYRYPDKVQWNEIIERPTRSLSGLTKEVQPIFDAVRARGDEAIRELTLQFDQVEINTLRLSPETLAPATDRVSDELKDAIEVAISNIERFHRAYVEEIAIVETMPGVQCWRRSLPIDAVGLYVPGGSAPLFSSVLMLGIPARIAGCKRVVLMTPPRRDGQVDPTILYAAGRVGISEVYRVGGAQAIAALALGSESIPRVDKIFGPGNQFVTAAKQLASVEGTAIDMPAGPTEVAIIADESCDPRFAAYDVLSQAEHGPDSHILFVSDSEVYIESVMREVEAGLADLPRRSIASEALNGSRAVLVADLAEAMDLVNRYAPEHLILAVREADRLAEMVTSAGSVFVGVMSPEAAGDYATGTNHTLPTNGNARAYSGVSVDSFVKRITFQRLTRAGLSNVGPSVEVMARAEGLAGHAQAVSLRLEATN